MRPISRRRFVRQGMSVAAAVPLLGQMATAHAAKKPKWKGPLIVSTWPFGKPANEAALQALKNGGSLLDAVEQGIWVAEKDVTNDSVGYGGTPNSAGVVQLDACIMNGVGHQAGSVAGLEGILHPISVARRVMEKTPHVMLVGEGARQFALEQGFENFNLLTEEKRQAWLKWKAEQDKKKDDKSHDTIALLVLGADGNIAGGCSTSGRGYKLPGRVGDSPIIGSGLYVDNEVGAAGATGIGENVMRYCGSFLVVEYMRQGLSPQQACMKVVQRIASKDPNGMKLSIHFIALDKQGRYGAAGSEHGFAYAVTSETESRVHPGAVAKGA